MLTTRERALIYIPIVHSQEDMGSLGSRLPGDQAFHRVAHARWEEIQRQARGLGLDWSRVKVYQDGLPDAAPQVLERILAEVQSPNYDLLRWLAAQGAEVVGTESPSLLKEEYAHLRDVLTARDAATRERARAAYAWRARELLAERDRYMARRIDETLLPGETGLLFVGQAHQVARYLAADIAVQPLPVVASAKSGSDNH